MDARRLSRIGMLSACGVAAYVFESFIPAPVPWARVGISNVVVIMALFAFGPAEAVLVTLMRVLAGNLLMGLLVSPALVMSLAGGLTSVGAMALVRRFLVPPLSVVGTSVAGAAASNAVQVYVFAMLFTGVGLPRQLLGAFVILGALVGLFTGLVAAGLLGKVALESRTAVD